LDPQKSNLPVKIEEAAKITSQILAPNSPFGIEFLVKDVQGIYAPRPALSRNGLGPFIELNPSEVYAVRIINNSEHDVAVTLTIDGLNIFAFSKDPDYRRLGKVLIPRRSSHAVIMGWHHFDGKGGSSEFTIAEYAKNRADQLGIGQQQVGTVTVVFALAWRDDKERPADEPPAGGAPRGSVMTEPGKQTDNTFVKTVTYIGVPRAVISVRYDKAPPKDLPPACSLERDGVDR
jgi:hypothetical protein